MKRSFTACVLAAVLVAALLTGCQGTKQTAAASEADSSIASSSSEAASSDVSSETVSSVSSAASSAVSSTAVSAKTYTVIAAAPAKTTTAAAVVKSSLSTGGYLSAQKVALSTATAGAAIYYTTNGSIPTAKSIRYKGPFTVAVTTTVKAVAVKAGMRNSVVSSYTYVFTRLSGNITADGSTALQPLLSLAGPLFKSKNSAVFSGAINIEGGGSGQGLSDVESGAVMIGDSDVTVTQAGKSFTDLVDHPICTVAVAMVVSRDVAAHFGSNAISIGSIKKIYEGVYTNWNQVPGSNGYNQAIMVCYRKNGSGTRCLFETFGTGEKFNENADYVKNSDAFVYTNASSDLQAKVDAGPGAIGYETLPYATKMTKLPVDFGSGAAACSYANVNNGSYKIWGYEHLYTKGKPNATVQAFIDFVTSTDFQSTILSNGYGLSSDVPDSVGNSHK